MCYCNIRLHNGNDEEFCREIENIPGVVGLVRHTVEDEKTGRKREEILVRKIGPINQVTAEINRKFNLDETINEIRKKEGVIEAKIVDEIDGKLIGGRTERIESGIF